MLYKFCILSCPAEVCGQPLSSIKRHSQKRFAILSSGQVRSIYFSRSFRGGKPKCLFDHRLMHNMVINKLAAMRTDKQIHTIFTGKRSR